eukprot:1188256-Prorocentrum_minimum.AAC.4
MAEERPNAQGEEEELKPPPEKRKKQKKDPTRRLCPRGGANKVIYEYVVNQKLITDEAELDQFCEVRISDFERCACCACCLFTQRQTFSIHMHEVQSRYKQWCEPTFSKHREGRCGRVFRRRVVSTLRTPIRIQCRSCLGRFQWYSE